MCHVTENKDTESDVSLEHQSGGTQPQCWDFQGKIIRACFGSRDATDPKTHTLINIFHERFLSHITHLVHLS